jgi:hypothetical protein
LTTYLLIPLGKERKGANSIPMVTGTDKSDLQLKIPSKILKAHLIMSDELFCCPYFNQYEQENKKAHRLNSIFLEQA